MANNKIWNKVLVAGIIALVVGVNIASSNGKIDKAVCGNTLYYGNLLGYVNDTSGNAIEGALVRVYFHGTYREDYSDEDGFYHVTNIQLCWCMKDVFCYKKGYKTKHVLLSIGENTVHDFILRSKGKMLKYVECNHKMEILSDYEEIITFIDGTCNNVTTKGIYIKRDVTFQVGENKGLEISGYYRSWSHFNKINVNYIHAPLFIGVIFSHYGGMTYSIWGIAIGNIDWE